MAYTPHGHYVPGTQPNPTPPKEVARCGGPGICHICSKFAAAYLPKEKQKLGENDGA